MINCQNNDVGICRSTFLGTRTRQTQPGSNRLRSGLDKNENYGPGPDRLKLGLDKNKNYGPEPDRLNPDLTDSDRVSTMIT